MTALGYAGWIGLLLFVGWLAGLATVQFWDNRIWRRDLVEDAANEAKLAKARAAQVERGDFAEVAA